MNFLTKLQGDLIKNPKHVIFLLVIWTLLLNGYGLGSLEFVRHTEADRTLISQELIENGDFLVPTLLGSEILTKPPLYYWASAFFLRLIDHNSVLVARLASLFSSVIFVLGTYYFWLRLTGRRRLSALVAFALSTSVLFYILASVAEIDMIFGCFCALSLYAGFLLYEVPKPFHFILYSLLLTLAFLAKGPPVYFFNIGAFGLFCVYDFYFSLKRKEVAFRTFILLLGLISSFLLLSIWLIPLSQRVGWEVLLSRLEEEVFSRVTNYSERDRGAFFYLYSFVLNSLPWGLFLLIGLYRLIKLEARSKIWYEDVGGFFKDLPVRRLFLFSLCVAYSGFMMLSVAQGKSSRYSFAVLPFFVNVAVLFSPVVLMKPYFKYFVLSYRLVSIVAVIVFVSLYVFGNLDGVRASDWIISGIFILAASFIGIYVSSLGFWRYSLIILGFLFFTIKVVQTHLYVSQRNYTRSVKYISKELVEIGRGLGQPIYTLELFKRWTVFYAKSEGVKILRLTPDLALERKSKADGRAYLLLDLEEESWRYYQSLLYSSDVVLERIFPHPSAACFLISVPNKILDKFDLNKAFPTHPSLPFYPELARKGII